MCLDTAVLFGRVSAYKDTIKFAKLRHFYQLKKNSMSAQMKPLILV